jgi:hypothetical protein
MLLYLVRRQSGGKMHKKGNMRDEANLNQLLVLANMESYNAVLIEQGKEQSECLVLLRELAVRQMETLASIRMDGLPQLLGNGMESLRKKRKTCWIKHGQCLLSKTCQLEFPSNSGVNISDFA